MSEKKYQVFVSSTFRDLSNERQDAIRNILDLNHIPAGMELFPASDIDQLEYIKKVIDECDYYILIMGGRYGSIDSYGISYTEREYDYAVNTGKIVLAFVHSDLNSIPIGKSDIEPHLTRALEAFRQKVTSGRLVKMWKDRHELEPLILKSLIHAFRDFPQTGWIRGNNAASSDLLEQSNSTLQENVKLKEKIKFLEENNIPKTIDGLASLEDNFLIRFRTGFRNEMSRKFEYRKKELTASWKEIFLSVAGLLNVSKTDSVIFYAIEELSNEKGNSYAIQDINETDKITIKVQLQALGLISTRVSKTTQGGFAEFLSLTQQGKELFFKERAIRKTQ